MGNAAPRAEAGLGLLAGILSLLLATVPQIPPAFAEDPGVLDTSWAKDLSITEGPSRAVATLEDGTTGAVWKKGEEAFFSLLPQGDGAASPPSSLGQALQPPVVAAGPFRTFVAGLVSDQGIALQAFGADGSPRAPPLLLGVQASFLSLAGGDAGFVATWVTAGPDPQVVLRKSQDGISWSPPTTIAPASFSSRAYGMTSGDKLLVGIADHRRFVVYEESPTGFIPVHEEPGLSSPDFTAIDSPPSFGIRKNDGIYVMVLGGAKPSSTKVTPKEDDSPRLGRTTSSYMLLTRRSGSVLRYGFAEGQPDGPWLLPPTGTTSVSVSERPGPSYSTYLYTRPEGEGVLLIYGREDAKGPFISWEYPPERSVIAGVVPLRVRASDETSIEEAPSFYIAPYSAGEGVLGERIDCLFIRPLDPPGPPEPLPPKGGLGKRNCKSKDPESPSYTRELRTKPQGISSPGEEVVFEVPFDTRQVPDGWYRFGASTKDTSKNASVAVLDPLIDNTEPTATITSPEEGVLVQDQVEVLGTVTDTTLASWSLDAVIPGVGAVRITEGGSQGVISDTLGTYKTTMAPAGYQGPVQLVLTATDSAQPAPNLASDTISVFSDDPRDAYGFLGVSQSYELSTTVPITADISGQLSYWRLSGYIEGETTPTLTPPSFETTGTSSGQGVLIAGWDLPSRWGPGRVFFRLETYDLQGDLYVDERTVEFLWEDAQIRLSSPSDADVVSGTIAVEGSITGSHIWAFAAGTPVSDTAPQFSPDGGRVVFESTRELFFSGSLAGPFIPAKKDIWIVNSDGTGLRRLTGGPGSTSAGHNWYPRFSPDGARILFVTNRDQNSEIYRMSETGTGVENLTRHPAADAFPAYSPDGSLIVFVSTREGREDGALWVMGPSGENPQLLLELEGGIRFPSFSPDGRFVVFEAGTPSYQQIYRLDLQADPQDPTRLIQLTFPEDQNPLDAASQPVYSPEGTLIAFVKRGDIWLMGPQGENPRPFVVSPGTDLDPSFSADATKLVFASDRSGTGELYIKDASDPTAEERLLIQDGTFHQDRSGSYSPQRYPFPPSATRLPSPKIDIFAFREGSYLKEPPGQFPQGKRPQGVLGHIDTSLLGAGHQAISVVVLQCPEPPPEFVFRLPRQYDEETSKTIEVLSRCWSVHQTRKIKVAVYSAAVEARLDLHRLGPGYAGPLAVTETYQARGSYLAPDAWALEDPPEDSTKGPKPYLVRRAGRMWAKGPPATSGEAFLAVGDPIALGPEQGSLLTSPREALASLTGVPPEEGGLEEFAPGRWGMRLSAQLPEGSSGFGGASRVFVWEDQQTGLCGALAYSYSTPPEGPWVQLPQPGDPWAPPQGAFLSVSVRLVFSRYNGDAFVPQVPEAGG